MASEASESNAPKKKLSPAQIAAQLTWQLNGDLKNLQIHRLRVAGMLVRFRDEKRYADLGYKDIEHYAAERLRLEKTSLYRYLKIYDWVKANRPAWLEPHPKDFIPDLSDLVDLMWIEKELAQKGLASGRKAELLALRKKAEKGELLQKEVSAIRRRSRKPGKGLSAFLVALRALLRRAARLTGMPPDVVEHLEAAVGLLENRETLAVAGAEILDDSSWHAGRTDFT